MSSATRWRALGVAALLLLLGWFALGNAFEPERRRESALLPDDGVRLGLDLQGGIHWVLSPDFDVPVVRELDVLRAGMAAGLEEKGKSWARAVVIDGQLEIEARDATDLAAIREAADATGVLRVVRESAPEVVFVLTDDWVREVRQRTMLQVLEVLRRRIDDPVKGVPESVVTRQGEERVLVQIPGGQIDREEARKLLEETAFLEFKIVMDGAPSEELLLAKYPDGLPEATQVVKEYDDTSGEKRVVNAYLVKNTADLTGDYLTDARSRLDNRYGWVVDFSFDSEGARRFGKLSGDNIGRQLAILKDNEVYSAPTLQSRIGGGRGFIHGRFRPESASTLAIQMRAGSLPIPVQIEEERTVGPALGADSIAGGLRASMMGLALVVLFVMLYYRLSGCYASVALLTNLVMILGVMSMADATLTLPGIAGLVLTVGMAVDANVIIFERIREELRSGKLPRAAIRTGFNKALWTILDANITTLITAIVLFEYGTGPVKGFAVTLSIGIVTSVFSALVITRLMFEIYPGNRTVSTVSI